MTFTTSLFFSLFATVTLSTAHAQSFNQSSPSSELRTQIGIRLERTAPTNLVSSDRGGAELATGIYALVGEFAKQASADRTTAASQTLETLFSLIPNSDRAFSYMLPLYPKNAPTVVTALRRAIGQAGHIAMTDATLRMKFLDLVNERLERHAALATSDTRFLEVFDVWTSPLLEWRLLLNDRRTSPQTRERISEYLQTMTHAEREKIAQHDARVKQARGRVFACPNLFR